MNLQVENLGNDMSKLIVTVPAEDFEKAVAKSFQKNKGKYQVAGFRKGKVPQNMIEKVYGEGVFFEDAVNDILEETYPKAMEESGLDIVSKAKFDVTEIGKNKDFIYTAEIATRPEVKLGAYKGIEIDKPEEEVTDADIDEELKKQQSQNARLVTVTDKAAQVGDTAYIDFEGFCDGEAFEGGKGEDYPLELGSHSFIEGFEDQVAGHKAGDSFDVNVTFPENYQAENLKGKPALFKVTLKELKSKELPEIDDEFASEVSEFDTLDEWKNDMKTKLAEKKKESAKIQKENKCSDEAVNNAEVTLPELMIETRIDDVINDYSRNMQMQGLKFEDYLKYTGMNLQQFREKIKPQAEMELKSSLVLEAIAKAENLEASDDDVNAEIKKMGESYGMEAEKVAEYLGEAGKKDIRENLKIKKAVEFLVENAKLK